MTLSSQYFGAAVHDGKIGILDIGSNSVRMVIYDGMKRAPMPVFNEKSFCELGKGVATTGRLNPQGVEMARECIARFLVIAQVMDVVELYVLATAAVRDAADGKTFVREIEQKHGVRVQILSGKQEARLAARGVQAALHQVEGLVGDLGGGSFELVRVQGSKLHQHESLPLGALRLRNDSNDSITAAADYARAQYRELGWLKNHPMDTFYAVGGSFRSLAHAFLLKQHYPLEVLHAYEVQVAEFLPYLRRFALLDEAEVAAMPGTSRKRAHSLPYAAVALAELLEHVGIQRIVFSTAGIREGLLYEQLSPYVQQEDALIASCVDLASQNGRMEGYAREVFDWIAPLFPDEDETERRLRCACCVLSEFAWRIHPQYRSEWMFTRIIQSSLIGMSHRERVMLAGALYRRHTLKTPLRTRSTQLLTARDKAWCKAMGAALAVGFRLSGGMVGVLPKVGMGITRVHEVELSLPTELQELVSDALKKRVDGLGEMLKALSKYAR